MELENRRFRGISGGTLKIIAITAMLIDHIAAILLHNQTNTELYFVMRCIGRLAFPIFCFLLVEGFVHTHDDKKYAIRLALFALISEVPFDLAFSYQIFAPDYQNVYFTLLIGLLVLMGIKRAGTNKAIYILIIAVGCLAAWALKTDYGFYGILMILFFYFYRNNQLLRGIFVEGVCISMGYIEALAGLSFLPLYFYNGKRGIRLKYIFYAFYPVHIFILYLIRLYY
jgi:TraX protein.